MDGWCSLLRLVRRIILRTSPRSPVSENGPLNGETPSVVRSLRFLALVYQESPLSFLGSLRGDGQMGALIFCIKM